MDFGSIASSLLNATENQANATENQALLQNVALNQIANQQRAMNAGVPPYGVDLLSAWKAPDPSVEELRVRRARLDIDLDAAMYRRLSPQA